MSPKKSSRNTRIHTSPATRKKKVSLPVQITRVQEHDDPITLENPFTIHPLPSMEENITTTPISEISKSEEVSFTSSPVSDFQESVSQLPPVESVPALSPPPSVLDLPVDKEEMHQSTLTDTDESVAEQAPVLDADQLNPKDLIKVNFATFVELVASQDFEKIVEQHANQELIMSTNLLSKLASLRDNREEKKIPLVFLVGIAIGVVLTYIFFSTSG